MFCFAFVLILFQQTLSWNNAQDIIVAEKPPSLPTLEIKQRLLRQMESKFVFSKIRRNCPSKVGQRSPG